MAYITIKEFAEKENLPLDSVRAMCKEGILPRIKAGRGYYVNFERADQVLRDMEKEPIRRGKARRKRRTYATKTESLTGMECIEQLLADAERKGNEEK